MFASIIVLFLMIFFFLYLIYITKNHKNYEKRNLDNDYMILFFQNFLIINIFAVIFISFNDIFFQSGYIPSIQKIIFYLLITDTIYYWTHRIIHRVPILKQFFHETHHKAFDLLPIDIFYENTTEFLLYLFYGTLLPIILGVNITEALILFGIATAHPIYLHSEKENNFLPGFIDSTFHKHHHQIGKGNYALYFDIWDNYMKTRIPPPNSKPKEE